MLIRYLYPLTASAGSIPDVIYLLVLKRLLTRDLPKKDNTKLDPLISILKNFIMKGIVRYTPIQFYNVCVYRRRLREQLAPLLFL